MATTTKFRISYYEDITSNQGKKYTYIELPKNEATIEQALTTIFTQLNCKTLELGQKQGAFVSYYYGGRRRPLSNHYNVQVPYNVLCAPRGTEHNNKTARVTRIEVWAEKPLEKELDKNALVQFYVSSSSAPGGLYNINK